MGLFDNISQNRNTGHMTFTQQAAAFAKLDLNKIFTEGAKATIELLGNAVAFFSDVFGSSSCNDQDRVLYERMKDQIPGMIIVLVNLGWEDGTLLDAFNDDPNRADYGGRPHGAFPCNQGIGPARQLFTVLFGVRIVNSKYLDALDYGVDAYYNVDGGVWTSDIPRNAVERAVHLKKNFFAISTYNRVLWDMNKFQEFPLVAPIPDPSPTTGLGRLFSGNIFGVDVLNGYVQGDPIPDLPTSTTDPIIVTDPHSDIIYPDQPQQQSPTTSGPSGFLEKLVSFVKANPGVSLLVAAAVVYGIYEYNENN